MSDDRGAYLVRLIPDRFEEPGSDVEIPRVTRLKKC
mgnify:CR=1 FL=1